jgi:prepilin-type N-terminal cleavage/methylation domain-containing protein
MNPERRRGLVSGQDGLTLVEVLVALGIVGVALGALAIVVPVSSHGVQEGRQVSTATFLAEQMIERAQTAAWSDSPVIDCLGVSVGDTPPVPSGATCRGLTSTPFPDETVGIADHPQYRRRVRVTSCAAAPCAGISTSAMRRVEVIVVYAPLLSQATSPGDRAVRLERLVVQK